MRLQSDENYYLRNKMYCFYQELLIKFYSLSEEMFLSSGKTSKISTPYLIGLTLIKIL